MAGRILTDDGGRAFDTNGNPISGAKRKAFLAGTSTPVTLYTTSALNVAHANPVVANSAGFYAQIWAADDQLLDIKDYAAADTTYVTPLRQYLNVSPQGALGLFDPGGENAEIRSIQEKLRETVSVTDFEGLVNDGTAEDSLAFQRAHDALPNGGIILVPKSANAYRVARVTITNPNICFHVENGATLKKFGSGGVSEGPDIFGYRGMFMVLNFLDANFVLEGEGPGSVIDLNGEGPIGIGVAGRIPNTYAELTVAGTKGIAATGNATIFALRSSHIEVHRLQVMNTSEAGFVFRNCSDTLVNRAIVRNCAHHGVEWSYPAAEAEGGTGPMPDLSRNYVRNSKFFDINDWALQTGNGVGVGGGGVAPGILYDHEVTNCVMTRCQAAVVLEISTGNSHWDRGKIEVTSVDSAGASVVIVNAKSFETRLTVRDGGGAGPTAGLPTGTGWSEISAYAVSGAKSANNHAHLNIVDSRNTKVYKATDGAITAGDTTFTSASASFVDADIGRWIGIMGAGPSGICHQARITSRNSGTSVEIERPAVISVSGATYAYGAALRRGVVVNGGGDLTLTGIVEAGIASGLSGEPDAAAVYIDSVVAGRIDTSGLTVVAPTTLGTTPTGVLLEGALTGAGRFRPGNMTVKGFTNNFVGTGTNQTSCETPTYRTRGSTANPSATIDTYGTALTLTPRAGRWHMITGVALTFASVGSETVSVQLVASYEDGGDDTLVLTSTSSQTLNLTTDQLAQLMRDNRLIRQFQASSKSSIGASGATVAVTFLAVGP